VNRSPFPLLRTHLIYGPLYASHAGARGVIYIDYRRRQGGTMECNQRRRVAPERRVNIKSRLLRDCLQRSSRIFLRLFVARSPLDAISDRGSTAASIHGGPSTVNLVRAMRSFPNHRFYNSAIDRGGGSSAGHSTRRFRRKRRLFTRTAYYPQR